MTYLRRALAIAWKDIRLEWRSLEQLSSMLFFSVLLLVVLHMSFDFSSLGFTELGAGVLWVCIVFSGMVGLGHSFVQERGNGCLQGLMMCPGERSQIYVGKFLANTLFLLAVEAVVVPLAAFLFNYYLPQVLLGLALVLILFTLGFSALGTLFAAMSSATQRGAVLLSILLLPLLLPVIMISVAAAGRLIGGATVADIWTYLIVNLCYDVIVIVGSILFFPYVIED